MKKSLIVLAILAIPITAIVWSYVYMMAGDCPGLDGYELSACITQQNNAGYAALAVCALIYGVLVMVIRRKGQR